MKRPSFQFRTQPSAFIDAQEFIIWAIPYTASEIGETMTRICEAIQGRETKFLSQFPFVVRFLKGTQKYPSLPIDHRRKVLSTGACKFCGSTSNLTVDHIRPQSKGGGHELSNLQCLCFSCNLKKSDTYENA
jgi:5-methylcytosine-specific restriction enzyme A